MRSYSVFVCTAVSVFWSQRRGQWKKEKAILNPNKVKGQSSIFIVKQIIKPEVQQLKLYTQPCYLARQ